MCCNNLYQICQKVSQSPLSPFSLCVYLPISIFFYPTLSFCINLSLYFSLIFLLLPSFIAKFCATPCCVCVCGGAYVSKNNEAQFLSSNVRSLLQTYPLPSHPVIHTPPPLPPGRGGIVPCLTPPLVVHQKFKDPPPSLPLLLYCLSLQKMGGGVNHTNMK